MADISEWSPVDESNNQPPPAGFPEFMAPSGLNNGARAMMGAVRRWYDTVTAQLTSLTTSLAGYLPLTGGTVTGNLAVNGSGGLYLSGVQLRNNGGGLDVSTTTGAGGGGIYVHGPESGVYWGDTDQVSPAWGWFATAGTAYMWQSVTGNVLTVTSSGIVSASVALNSVQYQIQGTLFAQRAATNDAFHIFDNGGNLAIALHAGESYYRANTHHWQNDAGTETATLNSAGGLSLTASVSAPAVSATTVAASGTISAGALTAASATINALAVNTNITATGTLTAGTVTATGTVNAVTVAATGTVSGNLLSGGSVSSNTTSNALQFNLRSAPFASMDAGITTTVLYDPSAVANITMYGAAATNYYDQNHHEFRNRGGGTRYCYFNAGGSFNALGGPWGTISESGLKEDITPYVRGLDAVLALDPVSFVYRAGTPFADEARTVRYGLLADAVAPVLPETVGEAEFEIDGALRTVQTLQLGPLTFVLLNAVKELAARIEALEGGGP